MPVIESAAVQLCDAINANPSEAGVVDGFDAMFGRGVDDVDSALVMITAIHHACPAARGVDRECHGPDRGRGALHETPLMGLELPSCRESEDLARI